MSKSSHDDRDLFRKTVGDVRRLDGDHPEPYRAPRPPRAEQRRRQEREIVEGLLDHPADAVIESGDELVFLRPGVQQRLLRRLRRGQFTVQGELDLHGHTVAEAHERLREFMREAKQNDLRCVRIVHGKGLSSPGKLPVLKGKVNAWLQRDGSVIAFCTAPPTDGGTGAVYVLLRKG
jgi:DNA-nicking Smr family endonuclease